MWFEIFPELIVVRYGCFSSNPPVVQQRTGQLASLHLPADWAYRHKWEYGFISKLLKQPLQNLHINYIKPAATIIQKPHKFGLLAYEWCRDITRSLNWSAAIFRRIRRIIFPLLVFGSPGAQWITSGTAKDPICDSSVHEYEYNKI